MTPKEKAEELVDKFYQTTPNEYFVNEPIGIKGRYKSWEQAKQCALIAVDEMISYFQKETFMMAYPEIAISEVTYWQEVKQETEVL